MYLFNRIYFVFLLFGASLAAPSSGKCHLIAKKNSFFAPLVFYENGTLYDIFDNENQAVLEAGQSIVLSCSPNYFKSLVPPRFPRNFQSTKATCVNGNTLEINHESLDYLNDFACDLRVLEEVLVNVPGCPSNNRGVDFGYYNPIDGNSYVIGESCYCTDKKQTIFAHVKLRNNTSDSHNIVLRQEHANYFKGAHPSYTARLQFLRTINAHNVNNRIEALLGSSDAIEIEHQRFINENYLSSKQFLSTLSFTWNDLVVVKNGRNVNNLDAIQKDVKELGVFSLDLYTGSSGVVHFNGPDNKPVDIYLDRGSFPVPKYVWILVKSEDKAVVFIFLNKPDTTDEEIQTSSPCEDKCPKLSWASNLLLNNQYKKVEDGYVWCCELKDVREKFTGIPDLVDVIGLFK